MFHAIKDVLLSSCVAFRCAVAPPPPTNLVWSSTPAIGGWNELLTWMAPNDYNYPSDLFKTHLTLQCKGLETLYEVSLSYTSLCTCLLCRAADLEEDC